MIASNTRRAIMNDNKVYWFDSYGRLWEIHGDGRMERVF